MQLKYEIPKNKLTLFIPILIVTIKLKGVEAMSYVIIENRRGEILLQFQADTNNWVLPSEDLVPGVHTRFFPLYDLPERLHPASELDIDNYAADHFWIGGD